MANGKNDLADIIELMKKDPWSYTCSHCGFLFPDYEALEQREPHGEYIITCPKCGSSELE